MKMVLSSRNQKKIAEMQALLRQYLGDNLEILSLDDIGCAEDIAEDGTTFEENAVIKASVPARMGYIGIADDSGLEVDALHGAPGIFSARFADDEGEGHDDERNNQKLLRLLKGVPTEKRTARYVCAIALVYPDGRQITVRGTCEGRILTEYQGSGGFGYDPLFFFPQYQKTLAQVTPEEKHAVSHRGAAVALLAQALTQGTKK